MAPLCHIGSTLHTEPAHLTRTFSLTHSVGFGLGHSRLNGEKVMVKRLRKSYQSAGLLPSLVSLHLAVPGRFSAPFSGSRSREVISPFNNLSSLADDICYNYADHPANGVLQPLREPESCRRTSLASITSQPNLSSSIYASSPFIRIFSFLSPRQGFFFFLRVVNSFLFLIL